MSTKATHRVLADASVGTAQLSSLAVPTKLTSEIGALNFRNKIINGDMRIDQRNNGAVFTYAGGGNPQYYGSTDRWAIFADQPSVGRLQRVATGNFAFPFATRLQRVPGSNNTYGLWTGQIIETLNCHGLAGKQVTLSFNAAAGSNYSSVNNTLSAEIWTGSGSDQTWNELTNLLWTNQTRPLIFTPSITTTFTRYQATITLPVNTNLVCVRFSFKPTGTAGANDYFDITQVQLEEGPVATPFEQRPIGLELSLCQRYYQYYSGNINIQGYTNIGTAMQYTIILPTQMRTTPTVNYTLGTSAYVSIYGLTTGGSNNRLFVYANSTLNPGVFSLVFNDTKLDAEL